MSVSHLYNKIVTFRLICGILEASNIELFEHALDLQEELVA